MLPVTNLRAGAVFKENNEPFLVLKYKHSKLGRGTANIKVKVKNLKTGITGERTFISGAKVEEAEVEKKSGQFLYLDGKKAVFMDPKSFEQFEVEQKVLAGRQKFLKEGVKVDILFFEGEPVDVQLPASVILKVKKTGPGVRGDTATNIFKPAVLENDLVVKVPLFIKAGDRIKVETRSGEYVERAR